MKKSLLLLLGAIAGMVAGMVIGYFLPKEKPPGTVTEKVETVCDTIPYFAPIAKAKLVTGTNLYTLPAYCFLGAGSGGQPRPQGEDSKEITLPDTTIAVPTYGTGAGGRSRLCRDSMLVELPMIQRHYADSTYEAWVSGPIDPKLDSITVFRPTTIITRQEWKPPKHWHIGITAGYGYGPEGFQPYIGVGLTYSIISF